MLLTREKVFLILVLLITIVFVVVLWQVSAAPTHFSADSGPNGATSAADDTTARTGRRPQPAQPVAPTALERVDGHLPLMIRWSNWRSDFGPAIVYARERDLDGMLRLDAPVVKMLMVTSVDETARLMRRADELHAAGVTLLGLNTENGLTPADEMRDLLLNDPQRNTIVRVAQLATENGFGVVWGPVRNVTDRVPADVIRLIMEAGVTGLSLQEQKFIEAQSADQRERAVSQTIARYQAIADEVGISDFAFHVQIMHERCPSLPNCVDFVARLERMPVASLAIWSNGPIPAAFVTALRAD